MTCIAWDGTTLAADKRSTNGGLARTVTKIHRSKRNGALIAATGEAHGGAELMAWYEAGAVPSDFPSSQRDSHQCSVLLAIEPGPRLEPWAIAQRGLRDGGPMPAPRILTFEAGPYPAQFEDCHFACGSGRDFALAGMRLGLTAAAAVALAIEFDSGCGNGVDAITFEDEPARTPMIFPPAGWG